MNQSTIDDRPARLLHEDEQQTLHRTWSRAPGILGWLTTTNHKDIAIRYIVTALVFFAFAGILALMMRLQLAAPEQQILGPDRYNQFFSVHGTAMMFLFAVPIMEGMALYFVPLMMGTRNVAFPRMNAFGYYLYLMGGLLLFGSLIVNVGPDTGWFSYVPLSGPQFSPGKRVDIWAQMISLTEISALVGAVEVITTVFKQRAPGMSLNRIPLFVWAQLVASFMIIFAMPSVMLVSSMLAMDRLTHVNTHFFNPAEGGDALLYQHLFWFFGHPEVYIIFVPASGFISEIVSTFARRPVIGYNAIFLSLISTGFIGFGLWVHHMFATPVPDMGQSFFTAASELIAIPSGIQVFCWIATLWMGRPQLRTPLMFVMGFLALFVLGGLTGVIVASVPLDLQVHDTYFVVAHFHYVLIGGAVFPLLGVIYLWFPKWTGRILSERAGHLNFWLIFIGFNLTFFPMHLLGMHGMTRRIYTYLPDTGWGNMNLLATCGAFIIALGILTLALNIIHSLRYGKIAGPNPWNGATLDWATTSPPAPYNFMYIPLVHGAHPVWEQRDDTPVIVGLSIHKREVLNTTLLDAKPQHRFELAEDSIWPLVLAVVVGVSFLGVIFNPWAAVLGLATSLAVLALWFWRGNEPKRILIQARRHEPVSEHQPHTPIFAEGGAG